MLPEIHLVEALRGIAPLVEIGAGAGYWAYRLRAAGVDVVAYDQAPVGGPRENRYHPKASGWSEVLVGDASVLAVHPDRTLLLCWPPAFSSLGTVLDSYRGDTVAYVGDRGPMCAWPSGLEERYKLVQRYPVVAIDPAPGSSPEMSVWTRRRTDRVYPGGRTGAG